MTLSLDVSVYAQNQQFIEDDKRTKHTANFSQSSQLSKNILKIFKRWKTLLSLRVLEWKLTRLEPHHYQIQIDISSQSSKNILKIWKYSKNKKAHDEHELALWLEEQESNYHPDISKSKGMLRNIECYKLFTSLLITQNIANILFYPIIK